MKRKVVKQGASTLMISLPSKWTKQLGIKKGQDVNIEEIDGNLLISKEQTTTKKQVKLNLAKYPESLIRVSITNAYRAGCDIIEILFDSSETYNKIIDVVNNYLIGFDVTKKEKNYCILENITEPSDEQFEVIFRKILYNIHLLINNTEERLKKQTKFTDYKDIVIKTHKYDNFCRRIITKNNLPATKASFYWTFLTLIGNGQRELLRLNEFLDANKTSFNEFEFYNNLKKVFELLSESYAKKDITKFEQIHKLEKEAIYGKLYNLIEKNGKDNIILYHIGVALKDFFLATSPLLGLLQSES